MPFLRFCFVFVWGLPSNSQEILRPHLVSFGLAGWKFKAQAQEYDTAQALWSCWCHQGHTWCYSGGCVMLKIKTQVIKTHVLKPLALVNSRKYSLRMRDEKVLNMYFEIPSELYMFRKIILF